VDAVDCLQSESEVGKTSYSAMRKLQAVTIVCRFHCGVAEVCAIPCALYSRWFFIEFFTLKWLARLRVRAFSSTYLSVNIVAIQQKEAEMWMEKKGKENERERGVDRRRKRESGRDEKGGI